MTYVAPSCHGWKHFDCSDESETLFGHSGVRRERGKEVHCSRCSSVKESLNLCELQCIALQCWINWTIIVAPTMQYIATSYKQIVLLLSQNWCRKFSGNYSELQWATQQRTWGWSFSPSYFCLFLPVQPFSARRQKFKQDRWKGWVTRPWWFFLLFFLCVNLIDAIRNIGTQVKKSFPCCKNISCDPPICTRYSLFFKYQHIS